MAAQRKLTSNYYPIRQRAFWIGVSQVIISGLVLAGVAADALVGWGAWAVSVLDMLVIVGVLGIGVKDAEGRTTPLDETGNPLNPNYLRTHDRPVLPR